MGGVGDWSVCGDGVLYGRSTVIVGHAIVRRGSLTVRQSLIKPFYTLRISL